MELKRARARMCKFRVDRLMNNSANNGEDILLFPLLFQATVNENDKLCVGFRPAEKLCGLIKCIRKAGGSRRKFIKARKRGILEMRA